MFTRLLIVWNRRCGKRAYARYLAALNQADCGAELAEQMGIGQKHLNEARDRAAKIKKLMGE
jgi:hypothetical protein